MKRTIVVAASLALIVGLSACSGSDAKPMSKAANGGGVAASKSADTAATETPEASAPIDGDAVPESLADQNPAIDAEKNGGYKTKAGFAGFVSSEEADPQEEGVPVRVELDAKAPSDIAAVIKESGKSASVGKILVDNRKGFDEVMVGGFSAATAAGHGIDWQTFMESDISDDLDSDLSVDTYNNHLNDDTVKPGRIGVVWIVTENKVPERITNPMVEIDMEDHELYPYDASINGTNFDAPAAN